MNSTKSIDLPRLAAYCLTGKNQEETSIMEDLISKLRRDRVDKPVIYIGTGTCGYIAGAGRTMQATLNYLKEKEIDAEVDRKSVV